jgi:hypothetical protein
MTKFLCYFSTAFTVPVTVSSSGAFMSLNLHVTVQ